MVTKLGPCMLLWTNPGKKYPTQQQVYGHLPLILRTIRVRRARYSRHCWLDKDELISDVLQWTPTHGHTSAGWLAKMYVHQLCPDIGYRLVDLPGAMADWDGWWERLKGICTVGDDDEVSILFWFSSNGHWRITCYRYKRVLYERYKLCLFIGDCNIKDSNLHMCTNPITNSYLRERLMNQRVLFASRKLKLSNVLHFQCATNRLNAQIFSRGKMRYKAL